MGQRLIVPGSTTGEGQWLLEIEVGGRPERFSTKPATVDGVLYRGGLGNFVTSPAASPDKLGIAIDDNATDWAELAARGETVDWSPVRVWWWYPGQTLEEAVAVIDGVAIDVEIGDPDSSTRLTLTIDQRARDAATTVPATTAVADPTTWTHAPAGLEELIDPEAMGHYYPTVIGYPGSGDTSATVDSPTAGADIAVPALAVKTAGIGAFADADHFRLLVSEGIVGASQVTVWDLAADGATFTLHEDWEVVTATDLLGRVVTLAIPNDPTDLSPIVGRQWFSGWNNDAAPWGGAIKQDGVVLRGLGDVLVWALSKSGLRVDLEKQRAYAPALNHFKIDTFLNAPADLERWIEQSLVSLFPLRRMRSAAGLWYRLVDYQATAEDAVFHLDASLNQCRAVSPIRSVRGDTFNVFTVEYQYRPHNGRFTSRRILGPEHAHSVAFDSVDDRVIGSPLCRASVDRYGRRERPIIQTTATWSHTTVALALQAMAARDALPLRGITYEAPRLDHILPGDIGVIRDPERHLEDRVVMAEDVRVGGPTQEIDLVLLQAGDRGIA